MRRFSQAANTRSMKKRPLSALKSLPNELLLDVLAKVASASVDDLCKAKLVCKDFNKAAEDDYIYQSVSMNKFPLIPCGTRDQNWDKLFSFFKRCEESGNPEALYRQGLREYFDMMNTNSDSGLECLKKAVSKGHMEATYLYGVLLVCSGYEKQGLKLLSSLNFGLKAKGLKSVKECRDRVKAFVRSMWFNEVLVRKIESYRSHAKKCSDCGNTQYNDLIQRGWDWEDNIDNDDYEGCDSCKWHQQVIFFCDILRGYN